MVNAITVLCTCGGFKNHYEKVQGRQKGPETRQWSRTLSLERFRKWRNSSKGAKIHFMYCMLFLFVSVSISRPGPDWIQTLGSTRKTIFLNSSVKDKVWLRYLFWGPPYLPLAFSARFLNPPHVHSTVIAFTTVLLYNLPLLFSILQWSLNHTIQRILHQHLIFCECLT